MFARIFAETGVRDLMRGLLKLLVAHPQPPRMARIRGQYVQMDPRAWDADLDVRVNVGLGHGLDTDKYQVLADVATKMELIFQTAGLANPIVSPKQYRDTLVKMLRLRGRMDADAFFNDVPANWQPPAPQGGNDPQTLVAQAEAQKAQTQQQKAQADMALQQQKHDHAVAHQQSSLALKREQMLLQDQRERQKLAAEIELRTQEMNLKHIADLNAQQVAHDTKVDAEALRQQGSAAPAASLQTSGDIHLHGETLSVHGEHVHVPPAPAPERPKKRKLKITEGPDGVEVEDASEPRVKDV
jgi:hypothetical protein